MELPVQIERKKQLNKLFVPKCLASKTGEVLHLQYQQKTIQQDNCLEKKTSIYDFHIIHLRN